ncbi:integrin alpha-8-like isoform X3 [Tachypleus tridentatus]|uniref:integrin alpha-8-like isoform X3 n=1 Tax=Tachypleus tridentatus TaxID=6853 RepID=UPI003FD5D7C5
MGTVIFVHKDEKYVVIGAPGFCEWTGTGLGYLVNGGPHDLSEPAIPNPPFKYRHYPYIGYSVTTGHFFGPKSTESVVLGAPRDAKANGMVYIIDGHDFLFSKAFTIQAKLEGKQGLQPSPVKLMGSKAVNSRFGSAIARMGDLDQDGYEDLLIGAQESGNAVLLRSKPIVRVESELSFDKHLLDTKNMSCLYNKKKYSCVKVKFCILYTGGSLQKNLELQVSLMSDTRRSGIKFRGFFVLEGWITQNINQNLFLHESNWSCLSYDFYLQKKLMDLSAIAFLLSYKLPQKNYDSFCKNCPIMSKDNPQSVTKRMKFYTECVNGVCVSDLTLSVKILNYQRDKVLIIGQNTSLILEVEVTNQNDPAYYTEAFICLPPDVSVINQGRCSILNEEDKKSLQCDVGNPLIEGRSETFQVKLDTSKLTENTEKVQLNLSVTSQSREERPLNNKANLTILFASETYITISGFTKNEQILFGPGQPDKLLLEQGYVVMKVLPSPVELINFVVSIPTTLGTKTNHMLYIRQVEVGDGSDTYVPGNCDLNAVDDLNARHANGFRKDTPADDITDAKMHHILNCQTASCRNIYCYAGPFSSNKKITKILISAEIDTKAIEKVLIKTRLVYTGPPLPKIAATWIYVLSAIVGILLLVHLCYGMYRIGFFRRKKHEYLENMMKDVANKENIEVSNNFQENIT